MFGQNILQQNHYIPAFSKRKPTKNVIIYILSVFMPSISELDQLLLVCRAAH
jgi:hypothetical protein